MPAYSAKKREDNGEFLRLREDLKAGTPRPLYAFYGEERYLLEDAVRRLRDMIPEGTEEFNHHRLEGRTMTVNDLREAIDAMPAFSERTLTEVSDFDLAKLGEDARWELTAVLSDIPEWTTVAFIFDTVEFKIDGRTTSGKELKKLFTAVDFKPQDENSLTRWTRKHFASAGKRVTPEAARSLIDLTGGLMTNMKTEIDKLTAYVPGDTVDVRDVEAVVVPVLDAAVFQLTDALLGGRSDQAMEKLGELLRMNEAPHRILFGVSQKLRQLMIAKICLEEQVSQREFMALCDIKYGFQAKSLMDIARRATLRRCASLCRVAADTAWKLNSSSALGDGELMVEMAIRVLMESGAAR